jgi:hypothetical protein
VSELGVRPVLFQFSLVRTKDLLFVVAKVKIIKFSLVSQFILDVIDFVLEQTDSESPDQVVFVNLVCDVSLRSTQVFLDELVAFLVHDQNLAFYISEEHPFVIRPPIYFVFKKDVAFQPRCSEPSDKQAVGFVELPYSYILLDIFAEDLMHEDNEK